MADGVWQRSPAGLEIARADERLMAGFRAALPDLRDEDLLGSPYCVRDYVVDERFGGPEGLAAARAQLASRGLKLILDFVPNHVAPDHPWLATRSGCFVTGSDAELAERPDAYLHADPGYQERLVRFIENHDEPRAAATFAPGPARAAAVVTSTLPGARLYHDGQFEGRRKHLPIFLARGPSEPPDGDLRAFYERLLRAVAASGLRDGDWRLCACSGWPDNDSYRRLVAWAWGRELVVVNLSGAPTQARVRLPWGDLAGRRWTLTDRLDGSRYERDGDELAREGLYVGLAPWGFHFLGGA